MEFEAQDGRPYVKLQAKEEDGSWARAQGHVFSWCGNSYFATPKLSDGHFLELRGLSAPAGEMREVRYRLYGRDVVSNAGKGRVDPAEVRACRGDSFAARFERAADRPGARSSRASFIDGMGPRCGRRREPARAGGPR